MLGEARQEEYNRAMNRRPLSAIVLAAGEGTRMRSAMPKPLHRLCGRPMILYVLDALGVLNPERVVVVVGDGATEVVKPVQAEAPQHLAIQFVEQFEPRGTGDAVGVALTGLSGSSGAADFDEGDVIVLPGDMPLADPGDALVARRGSSGERGCCDAAHRRARRAERLLEGHP